MGSGRSPVADVETGAGAGADVGAEEGEGAGAEVGAGEEVGAVPDVAAVLESEAAGPAPPAAKLCKCSGIPSLRYSKARSGLLYAARIAART